MYSDRIENLIKAALADGKVTEQERAILLRKASEENIDLDEFNMVLDARIAEMQKNGGGAAKSPQRAATEKQGNMIKCPSCGAPVPSMSAVCPECGHEFRNVATVQSAQQLFETLQDVERRKSRALRSGKMRPSDIDRQFHKEKLTVIRTFPVPNSKEDLMEMLAMTSSNAYDNDGVVGRDEEAWLQKTDQVYQKVVMVCSNDRETLQRATSMVTSLMRRLPKDYKEFTHLPNEMLQFAQSELAESKKRANEYRNEKTVEYLKSPLAIGCVVGVVVSILMMALGKNSSGIPFFGFIILLASLGLMIKVFKKINKIRSSNGIYE